MPFITSTADIQKKVLAAQSCDPMDCSSPGSSVHEILQARILEWVVIPFSKGSSQIRDWTHICSITGRFFTIWATREALYCQASEHWKSKRVPEKHLLPLYWLCQRLWLCGSQQIVENSSRDGNTRPHFLPPQKSVCRKKQQLELDMEKQTGSKSGKEYVKAVYCHPAYLTYMQSTSWQMPGWMKHTLESRLPGEISITSDMQMTTPLRQKAKKNWRASWWK